ncbi:PAS domain-containing sensor histidine kinase [Amylibacter sp.]|nr:PAS domain-containing sensor histidine kinase [Amylibacter sp.]MDC1489534.1 PAS domain-containing sensor histidine kinase [Amylibacter sp.]MDC3303162.1 PAS domain-containing sensor histidine kinase [Amylibacter sp.]|tara:strand:- start:166 stop:2433 length:2268 start_codon:yes stop_codon:yes gene_type:complete
MIDNFKRKIKQWRNRRKFLIISAWSLILLGPILTGLTVYILQGEFGSNLSNVLRFILLIDGIYLLVVIAIVGYSVMRMFAARRAKSAGSRLHMRLSRVFAIVALIPTVLVAVFAVVTLSIGVEGWFSKNVQNVVSSSLSAAKAYKNEQSNDLKVDLKFMAIRLNEYKDTNSFVSDSDLRLQLISYQNLIQRGLKEAYIIDENANLRSRGELSYLFGYEEPNQEAMDSAKTGDLFIIEDWPNNEFRGLIKLESFADKYLYISRVVDGNILNLLDKTMESAITYNTMEAQREKILWSYGLLYFGFATFVILSSILLGMLFAERLSRPVGRLAGAAQRLGAGDFDVQVIEEKGDDEIAMLSRVFNHMTKQVKRQRDDLITANDYTERRRRLFDSVLSGVTAGVIGLSSDGNVGFINLAAEKLLNLNAENHEGKSIKLAVPEFVDLFLLIQKNENKTQQQEIKLTRAGATEILLVRVSARISEDLLVEGYVITFDDVTDLVSAQRLAAWGDVARRIAHEIKNPLTPIQLSAERLKRKYSPMVGAEEDNLSQYCDVIIRQTNDLRRIVDEFSKFARMPEPIKRSVNITKLLKDVILLFEISSPAIKIKLKNPHGDINVNVDETMINQAFTNLIKNAGEAIESKAKLNSTNKFDPEIRIFIKKNVNNLEIIIEDNGIGLPTQERSRLFEPYVTNRENGTGLGLSIVKKIIEEHNGSLELLDASPFSNNEDFGAKMRIIFPKEIIIDNEKIANNSIEVEEHG